MKKHIHHGKYCVFFLITFLLGLVASNFAIAAVFKCVDEAGKIEFRDHPCKNDSEVQTVLPIRYQKTQTKVLKKEQTLLKNQEIDLNKQERKTARLQKQNEKQREKEQKKAKRLDLRCRAVRSKIKDIESRLRAGCKAKRAQRLREKELILIGQEREVCEKP